MLADIVSYLACPNCRAGLAVRGATLCCENGHVFDIARQGYVNLASARAHTDTGDTSEMVHARERFLASERYDPIAEALAQLADTALATCEGGAVVEIGAGTGYYLARVLERDPTRLGIALDTSKPALRRAARAHPRLGAVAADAWSELPVRDGAACLVLSVFSPRNAREIARILHSGGAFIVVTPTPRHLAEIVDRLGLLTVDARKDERLEEQLSGFLRRTAETSLAFEMALSRDEIVDLVSMGPSARHVHREELVSRVGNLGEPVVATASVTLSVFEPL